MHTEIDISTYIMDRVPESISVYHSRTRITVTWMEGARICSMSRAYNPAKLEQTCDELADSVSRRMGY